MPFISLAFPTLPVGLASLKARITRCIGYIEVALQVRRERRLLLGMNEHALKDLGLLKGDAYAEAQRSFWDVPVERLCR
jgi:uncharacterized protein YjiS (DUF1127 family)